VEEGTGSAGLWNNQLQQEAFVLGHSQTGKHTGSESAILSIRCGGSVLFVAQKVYLYSFRIGVGWMLLRQTRMQVEVGTPFLPSAMSDARHCSIRKQL
jgi:hypothetical protein